MLSMIHGEVTAPLSICAFQQIALKRRRVLKNGCETRGYVEIYYGRAEINQSELFTKVLLSFD